MLSEHRAVLGLLALGFAGQVLRLLVSDPSPAPGDVQLLGSAGASTIVARRDSLARLARPLGTGDRIDIDRAPAHELTRLPGVGPALAQRIVAERERGGPFGDFVALSRVRGVGPAVIAQIAPHLAFSGLIQQAPAETLKARRRKPARATGSGRAVSVAPLGPPPDALNHGSVAQLDKLPGIGRVRAERIVAFRDSAGAFRRPEDLARVPGISLAFARRLWTVAGPP
jgi:competence ComEA-like helix-hairpin-helix protein